MRADDFMEGGNEMKKIFSTEEIRSCREDGECVQCGLCCYAFVTITPESIPFSSGDEDVNALIKSGFEFCQHISETKEGVFQCACHGVKEHPLLKDCTAWKGNNHNGKQSEYESIESVFKDKLMHCNQSQLLVVNRMIERGIIQFAISSKNFSKEALETFLITLLTNCETIPHALLLKMEIKKHFQKSNKATVKKFLEKKGINLKNLTTKQRVLLKIYLPQMYVR